MGSPRRRQRPPAGRRPGRPRERRQRRGRLGERRAAGHDVVHEHDRPARSPGGGAGRGREPPGQVAPALHRVQARGVTCPAAAAQHRPRAAGTPAARSSPAARRGQLPHVVAAPARTAAGELGTGTSSTGPRSGRGGPRGQQHGHRQGQRGPEGPASSARPCSLNASTAGRTGPAYGPAATVGGRPGGQRRGAASCGRASQRRARRHTSAPGHAAAGAGAGQQQVGQGAPAGRRGRAGSSSGRSAGLPMR